MDNTKKIFRYIKADGMLTAAPDLRRYLTGFPSSFGFVYTDAQESVFFTDPRYAEAAKAALHNEYISVNVAQTADSVLDYIKSKKVRRLAVPLDRLTVKEQEKLLQYRFKLTDSMPVFTKAMSVKSEEELEFIRKACEIAQTAYEALLGWLKEGLTENEVAGYLEYLMRKGGAQDRSFETIVAFGVNTSVPHHAAGQDKLRLGMPILLDFGCTYCGSWSDMTRTLWFGGNPTDEFTVRIWQHSRGSFREKRAGRQMRLRAIILLIAILTSFLLIHSVTVSESIFMSSRLSVLTVMRF